MDASGRTGSNGLLGESTLAEHELEHEHVPDCAPAGPRPHAHEGAQPAAQEVKGLRKTSLERGLAIFVDDE